MKIDDNFYLEVGLKEMPIEARPRFKKYIERVLQQRVGTNIINQVNQTLPPEKATEFAKISQIQNSEKDQQIINFLKENKVDYGQIVLATINELRGELRSNAQQILENTKTDSGQKIN